MELTRTIALSFLHLSGKASGSMDYLLDCIELSGESSKYSDSQVDDYGESMLDDYVHGSSAGKSEKTSGAASSGKSGKSGNVAVGKAHKSSGGYHDYAAASNDGYAHDSMGDSGKSGKTSSSSAGSSGSEGYGPNDNAHEGYGSGGGSDGSGVGDGKSGKHEMGGGYGHYNEDASRDGTCQ
jgi:hypothetical protein